MVKYSSLAECFRLLVRLPNVNKTNINATRARFHIHTVFGGRLFELENVRIPHAYQINFSNEKWFLALTNGMERAPTSIQLSSHKILTKLIIIYLSVYSNFNDFGGICGWRLGH